MSRAQDLKSATEETALEIINKAMFYANKRFKWVEQKIPGVDLRDIVHESYIDVLQGVRSGPSELPVVVLVCNTVKSKVSHLWDKERRRLVQKELQEGDYDDHANTQVELITDQLREAQRYMVQTAGRSDEQMIYNELCKIILEKVGDDKTLAGIVELYFTDPDMKPQDIAKKLCLTPKDVYQALRRLRRRLQDLKEVWIHAKS